MQKQNKFLRYDSKENDKFQFVRLKINTKVMHMEKESIYSIFPIFGKMIKNYFIQYNPAKAQKSGNQIKHICGLGASVG